MALSIAIGAKAVADRGAGSGVVGNRRIPTRAARKALIAVICVELAGVTGVVSAFSKPVER